MQWRKNKLGISEPATLRAYNSLGQTLRLKGNWSTAQGYLQQALEGQREVLGAEHPDMLSSAAGLASTYNYLGRWKKAEELFM